MLQNSKPKALFTIVAPHPTRLLGLVQNLRSFLRPYVEEQAAYFRQMDAAVVPTLLGTYVETVALLAVDVDQREPALAHAFLRHCLDFSIDNELETRVDSGRGKASTA